MNTETKKLKEFKLNQIYYFSIKENRLKKCNKGDSITIGYCSSEGEYTQDYVDLNEQDTTSYNYTNFVIHFNGKYYGFIKDFPYTNNDINLLFNGEGFDELLSSKSFNFNTIYIIKKDNKYFCAFYNLSNSNIYNDVDDVEYLKDNIYIFHKTDGTNELLWPSNSLEFAINKKLKDFSKDKKWIVKNDYFRYSKTSAQIIDYDGKTINIHEIKTYGVNVGKITKKNIYFENDFKRKLFIPEYILMDKEGYITSIVFDKDFNIYRLENLEVKEKTNYSLFNCFPFTYGYPYYTKKENTIYANIYDISGISNIIKNYRENLRKILDIDLENYRIKSKKAKEEFYKQLEKNKNKIKLLEQIETYKINEETKIIKCVNDKYSLNFGGGYLFKNFEDYYAKKSED